MDYLADGGRGARRLAPPPPPRDLGDDFNWRARDHDAIRMAMVEELAARFPAHARWSPADQEVVLIEALAAALDQLSDMADRVSGEGWLETARRPESVRRLLGFIGFDAATQAGLADSATTSKEAQLEQLWTDSPALMEQARRSGPQDIHRQRRMVAPGDFTARAEEHPSVIRAAAGSHWTGAWTGMQLAVMLRWPGAQLDTTLQHTVGYDAAAAAAITRFHRDRGLPLPEVAPGSATTHRLVLAPLIDAYRMLGQPVDLRDAIGTGIDMALDIGVAPAYFRSEVRRVVEQALGNGHGGFFEPGRWRLGEDLHAGDIYQVLMGLEGVASVRLTRFKRVGAQYADHAADGLIGFSGLEVPVCDNEQRRPARGQWQAQLSGGRLG